MDLCVGKSRAEIERQKGQEWVAPSGCTSGGKSKRKGGTKKYRT